MFKKISCLVMVCIFMLSASIVNAQSSKNEGKVLFQAREITDIKQIEERMGKGITDDKDFKANCILSNNSITGSDYIKVKSTKATSQKIKETETDRGEIITEYSANIIANLSLLAGGGTEEVWDYDDPIGRNVKVYVNVTYTSGTLNGYPLYKIDTLKGKIERLDPSIVLSKIDIQEACYATAYTSISDSGRVGAQSYNQTVTVNGPSSNVYYNHNNLSPYYWNLADSTLTYIKGVTTGHISRGGTSWTALVTWSR